MKLIDKDALVTELNKLNKRFTNLDYPEYVDGYHYGINSVISFINTLEVKEVDLPTPEEIKKICTIYDNLKQERECATILYNSDETFFNHVLMEYKSITQKVE